MERRLGEGRHGTSERLGLQRRGDVLGALRHRRGAKLGDDRLPGEPTWVLGGAAMKKGNGYQVKNVYSGAVFPPGSGRRAARRSARRVRCDVRESLPGTRRQGTAEAGHLVVGDHHRRGRLPVRNQQPHARPSGLRRPLAPPRSRAEHFRRSHLRRPEVLRQICSPRSPAAPLSGRRAKT